VREDGDEDVVELSEIRPLATGAGETFTIGGDDFENDSSGDDFATDEIRPF
jgi:hypothetical protein